MPTSNATRYGNFRDLRGLLVRMLRSRDRSAYATLFREGLGKLLTPLDVMLAPWERRRIEAAPSSELPLILVVGMPRAGTTVVSQVLSRYLDVTYFNNLSALFPRSPLTASRWFGQLLPERRPSFASYFGNTPRLADPNEGFHIWNRWLGTDHYRVAQDISPQARRDMVRFLNAWLAAFGKPLLNKSVRNTDAIPILADAVRNAYFVGVKRDCRHVVESLIAAREQIQGGKAYSWGLFSREQSARSHPLGYVDDVYAQVVEMEDRLAQARREIGPERFMEVEYELFCSDPRRAVRTVASFVPNVRVREERLRRELRPFEVSKQSRLTTEEQARLEQLLGSGSSVRAPHFYADFKVPQ
jgi:hypothetical protein